MRREPGWWCGLAEFSPAATIVSKAVLSAPPRRMAVSSSRAKCSSVTPWLMSGSTSNRAASAMAAARSMRAISAASLRSRSASTALAVGDELVAAEELGPAALAAPGDVAGLEADAADAGAVERGAGRLPLLGSGADGDLDLRRRRPARAARPTGCGSGRRWSAARQVLRSRSARPAEPVNPVR